MAEATEVEIIVTAQLLVALAGKQLRGPTDAIAAVQMALASLACSTCYSDSTKEDVKATMTKCMDMLLDTLWDSHQAVRGRERTGLQP